MKHPNKEIMKEAIEYGLKHRTVGVIIVKGNKILVKCGGIFSKYYAAGHSEINAIIKASKKLKSEMLNGCWLYTTFEPCPMCMSAIIWAKIKGVVYGASMKDRNGEWTQRILIRAKDVIKYGNPRPKLIEEFMRKECKEILKL